MATMMSRRELATVFGMDEPLLEVRELAEEREARLDLLARERAQALGAEAFHRERAHHAAVEHRPLQHLAIELALGRDVSHEAAGKAVAGAGRIADLIERQRGCTEGML